MIINEKKSCFHADITAIEGSARNATSRAKRVPGREEINA